MMKKYMFFIVSIVFLLFAPYSCEEALENIDTQACNVENPLEELQWLKDIKQTVQLSMGPAGSQIIQYTYKGEPAFWVDLCYMCPDALVQVYNCEGEVICEFGGIDGRNTCPDFDTVAIDSTMLFISINN